MKILIKIAISALLLAVVIRGSNITEVATRLVSARFAILGTALAIMLSLSVAHTLRWMMVVRAIEARLGFVTALRFVFVGYFFSQMLPSSIGGDAARAWGAYRANLRLGTAASSVIVDRLMALAALVIMIAAASPWLLDILPNVLTRWMIVAVVVSAVAALAVLMGFDHLPEKMLRYRIVRPFVLLSVNVRKVFLHKRYSAPILLLSIAVQIAVSFVIYIIAMAIDVRIGLADCLLLIPLVTLVTTLPVSIAGWGLREGAMVVALGYVQVPSSGAFAISVLFGLIVLLTSLPGGVLWWAGGRAARMKSVVDTGPPFR